MTRRLGVLGWPVGHSRSPAIHAAVHQAHGVDASYVLLPVPPDDLPTAVRGLGALGFLGANVTVPHKQAVVALCDRLTDEAALIGAVNTLHWTADGLVGDNTDARGYVASLDDEAPGWDAEGARALVFGAGGAARAVVVGLARRGVAVAVAARRPEAATELAGLAGRAGAAGAEAVGLGEEALSAAVGAATLVVNATPLGMAGERLPAALHELRPGQVASDLVYEPRVTPFLADAQAAGARAVGGLGMLAHQAALAAARWHDLEPPVAACRSALD